MLQNEFKNFNDSIKIFGESEILREKRDMLISDFKKKFPDKCVENGIEIKTSDISFISQGSFKLQTTIRSKDGEVDLDQGVIFPLNIQDNDDPRKIKVLGKKALEIENIRSPKIKEPCITVSYLKNGEEHIHLDFPMYADYNGTLFLARGKEFGDYSWEVADPKGLNEYIISKLTSETGQPRRIIRFIKKWKQEVYSSNDSSEKKPPSIGLTLLAVDSLIEDSSDLVALRNVFEKIRNQFTVVSDQEGNIISAKITHTLPVSPFSNVFTKFDRSDNHGITFYKKVSKALVDLDNALACDNEHDAATYVVKVLGSEFSVPDKEIKASNVKVQREHSFG
ncbi:hypothetical protein KQI58_18375 [Enterococcus raffinosus]|uniref:cyclic GMP-AMP synthase DncV-like nucleotidyltransferase n=1 Tax=Enterococcus raffinosus TaxID=71452 RepID=UPI001C12712C|nr:hypothetical protein [Enterococcus raffinosus]MBU5363016.1 hypothetical protein [Enterococcus raffinosus]